MITLTFMVINNPTTFSLDATMVFNTQNMKTVGERSAAMGVSNNISTKSF